jgi:hypothetical protein
MALPSPSTENGFRWAFGTKCWFLLSAIATLLSEGWLKLTPETRHHPDWSAWSHATARWAWAAAEKMNRVSSRSTWSHEAR